MNYKKGSVSIIAIIAGIVAIGGVVALVAYVNNNQSDIEVMVDESRAERAEIAQENGYPDLWIEAGLPEYPNGDLTKTREGSNLSDGVQVTVETGDSMSTIETFWDTSIMSFGFTKNPGFPGTDYATLLGYSNGSKSLTVQITKIDEGPNNKIYLQYHE